ncbi:MAG TPA: SDR family NAD(P)-dependent oxidoreductase, partial [Solirubrobacteraceae bacterium]|nr:SDR family NAD(P)-dependent oxidoreductase [Solirubrobacteraceae bacterium]
RQALANAGLDAADVDAVEGHGTGTTLGDPIEVQALLATYGRSRPAGRPLRLGSIKSNIGHTSAAAGVGGVIKTVMAMRHGLLPATLHVDAPSPNVDWSAGQIKLLTEPEPWPQGERPRRAGISSFGISGTNAHVILEEAPAEPRLETGSEVVDDASAQDGCALVVVPWVLSARGGGGLRGQAGRLREFVVQDAGLRPGDVGLALTGRSQLRDRAVVLGESREELLGGAAALERGEDGGNVVRGVAGDGGERLAYLFTGQGAQWVGMGRELHEAFPVFRSAFDEACGYLDGPLEYALRRVVFGGESPDAGLLDETLFTQCGLFALEVALFRLLESFGVRPDFVVGHSVGELAAACMAGVFSLEDGCRLVAARGRLMGELPAGGAMIAVAADEAEALRSLRGFEGRVALAAVNGPSAVVLSGDADAVLELAELWAARGRKTRRLRVSHAFHSPRMDGVLERFAQVAQGVSFAAPAIPVVSNLTGEVVSAGELCDPTYWVRHLREPVRFAEGVGRLRSEGVGCFLELGPDGVLSAMALECLRAAEGDAPGALSAAVGGRGELSAAVGERSPVTAAPVLRPGRGEVRTLLDGLAEVWVRGTEVDWRTAFKGADARQVQLPTYAFQRKCHWISAAASASDARALGQSATEHPLLGAALHLAGQREGWVFTGRLSLQERPWLKDHAVMDTVLLPGTALLELALAVALRVGVDTVQELTLHAPLVLADEGATQLQLTVSPPGEQGHCEIGIYSCPVGPAEDAQQPQQWMLHAAGVLGPGGDESDAGEHLLTGDHEGWAGGVWPPVGADPVDVEFLYDRLAEAGYGYGPVFQGLRAAWRRGEELFAEVALAQEAGEVGGFAVHPALLDAALHALALEGLAARKTGEPQVPFSFSGVRQYGHGGRALRVRIRPADGGAEHGMQAHSLDVLDSAGAPVLRIEELSTRTVDLGALTVARGRRDDLYELEWVEVQGSSLNGATVHAVALGECAEVPGVELDERYADLGVLEDAIAEGASAPEVVLVDARTLAGTPAVEVEGGELAQRVHAVTTGALELLQGWLASEFLQEARLVFLAERAAVVAAGESPDLAQAALVGLLRSAHTEHPGRFCLLDSDGSAESLAAVRLALSRADEPELALRDGSLYAPRLARVQGAGATAAASGTGGTVLITGGTGGLGALVARHLVGEHGVRRLLLLSRGGPEAVGAVELRAALEEQGCAVRIEACDVADRARLAKVIASIPDEHALDTVIHAAGVLDDGVIGSLDAERLARVMAPKVDAAINLHELAGAAKLVLFSSAVGTLGGPGQANYAAANAFLDALAHHRRALGMPALSLAWGAWERASGMTGALGDADRSRLGRLGIVPLSDARGLALFDSARAMDHPVLLPARLDAAALRAQARVGVLPALMRGVIRAPTQSTAGAHRALATRLAEAPEAQWPTLVLQLVAEHIAGVLGHASGEAIDATRGFKEHGFDSLGAVELRNRLERATGLKLPATLVFDYPTPSAVAEHLLRKLSLGAAAAESKDVKRHLVAQDSEPIAIVGMSCRYPGGVQSPAQLWELLAAGSDAIGPFPEDRGWEVERLYDPDPSHVGTSYARHGGFLYDAGSFDAEHFHLPPREALAMDPQQRLLLEAAWEAIENAGIDPTSLRGSRTGVFSGVMYSDYGMGVGPVPAELEGYLSTGAGGSVLSGRVAYSFGLEGPAVSIDTACSSSLVAMHLAAQALRSEECELALAGGVTVLATPGIFVGFSRQRGLAPDGRCKSFGAGADGVGWSEGVGLVLLERLCDAQRNGHRVLAVVRGSAVNQDGASSGLTAPSGPAQEAVIAQALANAGLTPADIDAVEAHGTGTTLGDPIEAQALLGTYGQGRERQPLHLGSIKSNIGHTQAAAGAAGVIKIVKALEHGVLPRTLHAERPSPHVDWSQGEIALLGEPVPWPAAGRVRRAGVSSFGISGTNAHVILEEAPATASVPRGQTPTGDEPTPPSLEVLPFLLSGSSAGALRGQAGRLGEHLRASPELAPADVAFSLVSTRAQLAHRAVIVGKDRDALIAGLRALERGEEADGVFRGVHHHGGRLAFLFPGQGSQWAGMGRGLYAAFPVFANELDAVCAELDRHLDRPLQDLLFAAQDSADALLLDHTRFAQPALFALEVALYRLVRSVGVRPEFLIGHSIGELSAAHVAGVFSLADACTLVAARGRLMGSLPAGGAMLAVEASEREILESLSELPGDISLAAVNGPSATVVSGDAGALEQFAGAWLERRRKVTRLRVSHAFHSARMAPMLDELREIVAGLSLSEPELVIVSNVSGELAGGALARPEYWVMHVREAVRFRDGIDTLRREGVTRFLELGPGGALSSMVYGCLGEEEQARALVVSGLRARRSEAKAFVGFLAATHVHGAEVRWRSLFDAGRAARVPLPTYAFQRERFWLQGSAGSGDAASLGQSSAEHSVLGAAVQVADEATAWLFTGRLSLESHPWLVDHAVMDTPLLPGTGFLELVLAAGERAGLPSVEELVLKAPLVLGERDAVQLQLTVSDLDEEGRARVTVHARAEGSSEDAPHGGGWTLHATGVLGAAGEGPVPTELQRFAEATWPPPGEALDGELLYESLADAGYGYGRAFRGLRTAWRSGKDLFAEVVLDPESAGAAQGFTVHPALLDGALHALALGAAERGGVGEVEIPFMFSGVRLLGRGATSLRVRLRRSEGTSWSVLALDDEGVPVLSIDSLTARPLDPSHLRAATAASHDALYRLQWVQLPAAAEGSQMHAALLGDGGLQAGAWVGDGLERYADLQALQVAAEHGTPPPEVVLVEAPALARRSGIVEQESAGETIQAIHELTAWTLELLQRWLADARLGDSKLVLVTRGALTPAANEVPNLPQAALAGLLRSACAEHPGRFGLIDLDEHEASWSALRGLLGSEEPELAIRDGAVHAPRLARVGSGESLIPPAGEEAWHLSIERKGTLEHLALHASPRAHEPLGPGQVRVAVHVAGLNFRDVLVALGLYPGAASLGGEGAGVIVEVAPDVGDLAVGDRVMGLLGDAFGPVAVSESQWLVRIPAGWSFAQAASVPIVFLTAYYGLVDLARLGDGEAVLVHGGAGGVGMAAVQLATHLGAEVFATAHPSKWGTLRELGLDDAHIASSRTVEFQAKFSRATAARGVDVVLDSLTGDLVDASLALLGRGGRFIEMGKTDIRDPDEVAAAYPGVGYRAFDVVEAGSERIQAILRHAVDLFEQGALRHLPIAAWDVRRAPEAFRWLRESRHTGKVVLSVPQPPSPAGTVLITGGTGGLGGRVAAHLAGAGARHLLLASRSGPAAEGARELQAELRNLGCEARVAACDVSDRAQLAELLASISEEHPLVGVVHAAGVLDDGVIEALDGERLRKVMVPKVDAALNLHELTRDLDLAQFILFSSAAASLGSPGQANYAAANSALDALAHQRRAAGLPGVSLAWGAWAMATAMTGELGESDHARLRRQGVVALSTELGLELLDHARTIDEALLLPVGLDPSALRAHARSGMLPAILRGLVGSSARRVSAGGRGTLARALANAPESEWEGIVSGLVRTHVAAVLGHAGSEAIDSESAFKELGFDSLGAVELRNRLGHAAGLTLPATLIFDHPTPAAVTSFLLTKFASGAGAEQPRSSDEEAQRLVASIPVSRLRGAGVLDILLDLAKATDTEARLATVTDVDANGDDIETMSIDTLTQRFLEEVAE